MVPSLTESLPGAAASGQAADAEKAISFLGALRIPGVVEFSLCLFSTKLVSYVFLFWLPHYIQVSHCNAVNTRTLDMGSVHSVSSVAIFRARTPWRVWMLSRCPVWQTTTTTAP